MFPMVQVGEIAYIPINGKHIGLHDGKFRKEMSIKVGIFEEKNVTVKDIEGLLELSSNINIQKLYDHNHINERWYLALETFDVTLKEHMNIPNPERLSIDPISLIRGITNGLSYLHDLKIAHGNVSTQNIGISYKKKCAKICIANQDSEENVRGKI